MVTCSLGTWSPGAAKSVRITGTATRNGTLVATAEIDGDVNEPQAANDTDSASTLVR